MFMTIFILNIILVPLMIHYFFQIGMESFTKDTQCPDQELDSCKNYITIWMICSILNVLFNNGIIFCRFIYIRYANGLVTNGKKLLHILISCITGAFTFQWIGIQPLKYRFSNDNYPMNLLKGYICTKTKIPLIEDVDMSINFSIQPKLITISFCILLLFGNPYFTLSPHRMKRTCRIPKRKIHLLDLNMQNLYTASMILNFIIDQVLIGFIESNYKELGEDEVFRLWWGFHLLELLEIHLFANFLIVRNIQNIEEFHGYVGKTFSGQDKPRSMFIQPKRD